MTELLPTSSIVNRLTEINTEIARLEADAAEKKALLESAKSLAEARMASLEIMTVGGGSLMQKIVLLRAEMLGRDRARKAEAASRDRVIKAEIARGDRALRARINRTR